MLLRVGTNKIKNSKHDDPIRLRLDMTVKNHLCLKVNHTIPNAVSNGPFDICAQRKPYQSSTNLARGGSKIS